MAWEGGVNLQLFSKIVGGYAAPSKKKSSGGREVKEFKPPSSTHMLWGVGVKYQNRILKNKKNDGTTWDEHSFISFHFFVDSNDHRDVRSSFQHKSERLRSLCQRSNKTDGRWSHWRTYSIHKQVLFLVYMSRYCTKFTHTRM